MGGKMKAVAQEIQKAIIQAVADGMSYRDASLKFGVSLRTIGRYAHDYQRRKKQPTVCGLTELQLKVICDVAQGLSNAQIAEQLSIHTHTVRNQVYRSLGKLHLDRRSQLVIFAHQQHLINLDDVVLPRGKYEDEKSTTTTGPHDHC